MFFHDSYILLQQKFVLVPLSSDYFRDFPLNWELVKRLQEISQNADPHEAMALYGKLFSPVRSVLKYSVKHWNFRPIV